MNFFVFLSILTFQIKPWAISDDHWDLLRLRNNPRYLVEGKGAGSVLIGDREEDLFKNLGLPERRNYERAEKFFYKNSMFQGWFLIKNQRVYEIKYQVFYNDLTLFWSTALGLDYSKMINLDREEKDEKITNLYGKELVLIQGKYTLVLKRGIAFEYQKNRIVAIRIFSPYH